MLYLPLESKFVPKRRLTSPHGDAVILNSGPIDQDM